MPLGARDGASLLPFFGKGVVVGRGLTARIKGRDLFIPLSLPNIRFLRIGASFITMMQASNVGQGDDFSGAAYRAWNGCILFQGKMSATPVVVALKFGKYRAQVELIPDNDVVQAFASDGSNDAFCISVLPGAARRDWSVAYATAAQSSFEQMS